MLGFGASGFGQAPFGEGADSSISLVSPEDGATGVGPWVDYVFDFDSVAYEPDLLEVAFGDTHAVIHGVAQPGFSLGVEVTDTGRRITVSRSTPLAAGTLVACSVEASNGVDTLTLTSHFTVATAFALSAISVVDRRTVRFTFNREPKGDPALFERGNYEIDVRTGRKRKPVPASVSHTAGNAYVDVTLATYIEDGGDYVGAVRNIRDLLLLEITQ